MADSFSPKQGDIICVSRGLYKHYGIYSDDTSVIHFTPKSGFELNPKNADIQETTLADFLKGGTGEVDTASKPIYSPSETVQRAYSCLGKKKGEYNLIFNNCEHFARWCRSGVQKSHQVETGFAIAVGLTAAAVIGVGIANALRDKAKEEEI
ncbi:lecithin retinol acyltransferase family protein [Breznakiellaceae bacterium SP9]